MFDKEKIKKETGIIGNSLPIEEVLEMIIQISPVDISVLITGESGTGKELIAKAIHKYSRRYTKSLVTVNCGAIPEGIIESELFGHKKGSFTGATEEKTGYFEEANGGTIFLDEIGEMPLGTQVKLLRVLMLGPLILIVGLFFNKEGAELFSKNKIGTYIPWFVVGFIFASIIGSTNMLSGNIINILNNISKVLFSISMAGIGLTVAFKDLKVSALKISFAVLTSSLLMIGFAFIGLTLFRL